MNAPRIFRLAWLVAAMGAIGVLVGCSSSKSTAPTPPGGVSITFTFSFPAVGSSSSKVFASAGSFDYHCIAHQSLGMTGTVVVDATASADSALVEVGSGGTNVFVPASVTIKPGGLVRWVRPAGVSATNHTASR
ncbi:MAG: plastocyanin/azurin family copper-binding protein [Candidatus Eisenbacteria bacterium]